MEEIERDLENFRRAPCFSSRRWKGVRYGWGMCGKSLVRDGFMIWQNERLGSGRVNRIVGQIDYRSKIGHFKRVEIGFGSIVLQIGSGWPIFCQVDPYFSHEFFFFFNFYKENNIYLSFGKLGNKLFDVKYIILNSPVILRMNSVKLINSYSIILKLYKS